MTIPREVGQLALDNLESLVAYIQGSEPDLVMQVPAIEALRVALAAKEQEPVVGTKTWFDGEKVVTQNLHASDIYTAPPQREWQSLTDEEKADLIWKSDYEPIKIARAIETKLREKNGI